MTGKNQPAGYKLPVNPEVKQATIAQGFVTPKQDRVPQIQSIPPKRVLPIIFIPGIMGSNLRLSGKRQTEIGAKHNIAWRPDNLDVTGTQFNDSPSERQMRLDPSETELDIYDPVANPTGDANETADQRAKEVKPIIGYGVWGGGLLDGPLLQPDPPGTKNPKTMAQKARERGWGEVFIGSYYRVLSTCEMRMNGAFTGGNLDSYLKTNIVDVPPSKWESHTGSNPLEMVKMISRTGRKNFETCLLTVFLLLTFLVSASQREHSTWRNPVPTSRIQSIFATTRTACFGRFLIDVPLNATVVYGPTEVEMPIQFLKSHGDKVALYLSERMVQVEKERRLMLDDDFRRLPLFGKVLDGAIPGQKVVFGSRSQAGYSIDSFIPIEADLFIHKINTVHPDKDTLATMNEVAKNLRIRSEHEIPGEPGYCIEGGFVPLSHEYERIAIGLRFEEFPDVRFSIDAHKNQQLLAKTGALELMRKRAQESAEQAGLGAIFARIKVFRHQARQLGAWKGVEILSRTPAYKDNTEAHEFRYESLGAVHDSLQPRLDVRLDSGVVKNSKASTKPSITDEEALALWDKLISTIRVRQPSDATKPASAPGKTALSTPIPTGAACPKTGWWQCTDLTDIEGTGRQLVSVGEPMPHAVQLGKAGLWQKIMGVRPRYRLATTWRLLEDSAVEGAAAPAIGEPTATATNVAPLPAQGGNSAEPSAADASRRTC